MVGVQVTPFASPCPAHPSQQSHSVGRVLVHLTGRGAAGQLLGTGKGKGALLAQRQARYHGWFTPRKCIFFFLPREHSGLGERVRMGKGYRTISILH